MAMRANFVAAAVIVTLASGVSSHAQELGISNKTIILSNDRGDQHYHYYIGTSGRIYYKHRLNSSGIVSGDDSNWGYEYEIGKTLRFQTRVKSSAGLLKQEVQTRAGLSGSSLVLEYQTLERKGWVGWYTTTIILNGDACTATPSWGGSIACKIVEGRQLP
jgi:hypothetical protein